MKEETGNKDWLLIAKHLGNAEKIWELSDIRDSNRFSTDKGWNQMSSRIHKAKTIGKSSIFLQPMRIAASILILIGLGIATYWYIASSNYVKLTAENHKIIEPIVL